jgi:hypothetical protein
MTATCARCGREYNGRSGGCEGAQHGHEGCALNTSLVFVEIDRGCVCCGAHDIIFRRWWPGEPRPPAEIEWICFHCAAGDSE